MHFADNRRALETFMPLKIAVQMDHVSTISIAGDTSFALSLEAQRRGHELFHYTPDRLSLRDDKVFARIEAMQLRDEKGNHFTLGEPVRTDLSEMDVILLRQDPPFDMNYITTTHILERIHPEDAGGQRPGLGAQQPGKDLRHRIRRPDAGDADHQGPRRKSTAFRKEFGDIIIKPLYGNGGAGIFHLHEADRNLASLLEMFGQMFREPFIVQRYLKDVRKGDKRIILIDGEPVGAINRVPAEHDSRSNMHVGGRAEKTELTEREREICARIGPSLKAARLHPRRHRRDRRLHDRDQRHLADRHSRGQALRRRRHRGAVLGRGRGEARGRLTAAARTATRNRSIGLFL